MPESDFHPGPCLVLAPHLVYPCRTGANILIDRRWAAYSKLVPYVDIVATRETIRYEGGAIVSRESFDNAPRSKVEAAVRTMAKSSHYLHEKFVTGGFKRLATAKLTSDEYTTLVGSFLYTLPLLDADPHSCTRRHLIESHNDELKWYQTLGTASSNPVVKAAARQSAKWSRKTISKERLLSPTFLHLTKADAIGFEALAPNHNYIIAPIGVDIPQEEPIPQPPGDPVRLLFVGSLGVKMNADALTNFATNFYPLLKDQLGSDLIVDIVGHAPSEAVTQLCSANDWGLYPDAPDTLLETLLRKASFTLLPFEYATGAKLKLPESLAHGVPFLATTHVKPQLEEIPPSCLFADEPEKWLAHIGSIRDRGQSLEDRLELVEAARSHSWDASAQLVFDHLYG